VSPLLRDSANEVIKVTNLSNSNNDSEAQTREEEENPQPAAYQASENLLKMLEEGLQKENNFRKSRARPLLHIEDEEEVSTQELQVKPKIKEQNLEVEGGEETESNSAASRGSKGRLRRKVRVLKI